MHGLSGSISFFSPPLYLAMWAAARATWSMIKGSIEGIEDQVWAIRRPTRGRSPG
jgi:hypothetical protein